MSDHAFSISAGDKLFNCHTLILVPDTALSEPGYIRTFSTGTGIQGKHAFYALAQTAYIQFQDRELDAVAVDMPMAVYRDEETHEVASGMAIGRTVSGEIVVLYHSKESCRRLLEAAYRFCSRWIRLDIS
jgi:hypothetical protein